MRDWSKAEWVDPAYNWKPLPVPDMPDRLLVDFATRCNLRCHMCPVWGLEDLLFVVQSHSGMHMVHFVAFNEADGKQSLKVLSW